MTSRIARRTQIARVAACALILNFSVPGGAIVVYGTPLREGVAKGLAERAKAAKALAVRRAKSASRLLTAQEERTFQGRAGENPYLAGQSKWDVVYKGVDLMTGNFSTTATDLSFDGGYGIPVNVTRAYSANNGDEGPFGKGWTLSADVRSTAGGLLKGGSAPVRSVPTALKERPSAQDDPNVAVEPAAAVTATDAGGVEETIQKDVDGILTTPAWDKNVYDSTYEWVEFPAGSGQKVQVLVSNSVKTPEGAVYAYTKQGFYPNGTRPWNDASAAAQAANVLKVTSATDRQGNVTTYAYGSAWIDFAKANGVVREHPLAQVSMPGGHVIAFVWGTSGAALGRITSITDNPGAGEAYERKVQYGYGPGGLLTSVITPGGKTTTYGYANAIAPTDWSGAIATNLLATMTDPRGLSTTVSYVMGPIPLTGVGGTGFTSGPYAYRVVQPNGVRAYMRSGTLKIPDSDTPWPYGAFLPGTAIFEQHVGSGQGALVDRGFLLAGVGGVGTTYTIDVARNRFADGRPGSLAGVPAYAPEWRRSYDVASQNLTDEVHWTYALPDRSAALDLRVQRGFPAQANVAQSVETQKSYNFMGQPLDVTMQESHYPAATYSPVVDRTASLGYAYWGADKYFQQKAVKDQAGRISVTNYYPNTADAGKRGQTYRVYDPKHGGTGLDGNAAIPNYTPPVSPSSKWRYQVTYAPNQHAAEFDYDAKGRPTDVWKLQKTSPSWAYVRTHTTYSSDGAPVWGQASQVVEDYGGIDRTTQTLGYTPWGKANDVVDAAGHRFVTVFDKDGLVQSVTRTDGGSQPLVTYTYGTSGVSNGQPTSVTDGLTQVSQSIAYTELGGGIGQPATVTETSGSDVYSVGYAYDAVGNRQTTVYGTPNGTTRWRYSDYLSVGEATSPSQAFQTMTRLDALGAPTAEEFHYVYDGAGRLAATAFAQTPQSGQTYATAQAACRARTAYVYDGGGRLTDVSTYWDAQGSPSTLIAENACGYEVSANGTGLNRGLKTSSAFAMQGETARTETYGYDPKNDQLTEAHYGDSYPNPDETWGYDAAGNRSGNVCDDLNRATVAGNRPTTNDILGNRTSLTLGGQTIYYAWDELNRMTGTSRAGAWSATYGYRADGMRVSKQYDGVATRYRYDGQMTIEDVETPPTGNPTITRYGLGAAEAWTSSSGRSARRRRRASRSTTRTATTWAR